MFLTGGLGAAEDRPDILLSDFESTDYGDWLIEGRAFQAGPQESAKVYLERHGERFAVSRLFTKGSDQLNGTLTSPPFQANRRFLFFLVGGGAYPGKACVNLVHNGEVLDSWCGEESTKLRPVFADLDKWQGKSLQIQIVDEQVEGVGHIAADYFVLTDRMETPEVPIPDPASHPR